MRVCLIQTLLWVLVAVLLLLPSGEGYRRRRRPRRKLQNPTTILVCQDVWLPRMPTFRNSPKSNLTILPGSANVPNLHRYRKPLPSVQLFYNGKPLRRRRRKTTVPDVTTMFTPDPHLSESTTNGGLGRSTDVTFSNAPFPKSSPTSVSVPTIQSSGSPADPSSNPVSSEKSTEASTAPSTAITTTSDVTVGSSASLLTPASSSPVEAFTSTAVTSPATDTPSSPWWTSPTDSTSMSTAAHTVPSTSSSTTLLTVSQTQSTTSTAGPPSAISSLYPIALDNLNQSTVRTSWLTTAATMTSNSSAWWEVTAASHLPDSTISGGLWSTMSPTTSATVTGSSLPDGTSSGGVWSTLSQVTGSFMPDGTSSGGAWSTVSLTANATTPAVSDITAESTGTSLQPSDSSSYSTSTDYLEQSSSQTSWLWTGGTTFTNASVWFEVTTVTPVSTASDVLNSTVGTQSASSDTSTVLTTTPVPTTNQTESTLTTTMLTSSDSSTASSTTVTPTSNQTDSTSTTTTPTSSTELLDLPGTVTVPCPEVASPLLYGGNWPSESYWEGCTRVPNLWPTLEMACSAMTTEDAMFSRVLSQCCVSWQASACY